ncbi:hypothetical protein SteCoe_29134 [Stentor coeruleus]|uniref:Uncharacterized protein n=1 Tax=Stentor coeruleus TaxID=5963 RepID=A0A1R2B744_9CILI|nr:hypothetical protein SteCoe_29134 [Stentor coeruleus]
MEEDYQVFSEDIKKKIIAFGISYKWRDSCVNDLISWEVCKKDNPYFGFYQCSDIQKAWEKCEIEREKKIISTPYFRQVPEEKRRLSF